MVALKILFYFNDNYKRKLQIVEDPRLVSVIPNAIDSSMFTPDINAASKDRIVIVVVSRLVYR